MSTKAKATTPSKAALNTNAKSKSDVKSKDKQGGANLKLASTVGAPSQHTQSSRKGKKAWRKNVNVEDVEEGLEEVRVEERVIGWVTFRAPLDMGIFVGNGADILDFCFIGRV